MFDLKRPCTNCPFKRGNGTKFTLSPDRLEEIKTANAFQCHKTVDYSEIGDPKKRQGDRPQQCAGLMAVLNYESELNQIMQVAVRLNALVLSDIDPRNEAYSSWDQVMTAHIMEIEPD